ncbi:MAG: ABC transporter substrate-binding protein, partial [Burkholderiaceae bacterium]
MFATLVKASVAKKVLLTSAAAIAVAVAGCAPTDSTVKIGHVGPLTGSIAHLGKDNEAGAKLAIADLNKADIKIDGKKVTFTLISEDDGADPKQGTAAAQKLVDAKVVGVIGHLNSGTTIP